MEKLASYLIAVALFCMALSDAPSNPVRCLKHDNLHALALELLRSREPGEAAANDTHGDAGLSRARRWWWRRW